MFPLLYTHINQIEATKMTLIQLLKKLNSENVKYNVESTIKHNAQVNAYIEKLIEEKMQTIDAL